MKKLFILDESERERILNMHTSATSRQYLSEQEQDGDPDFVSAKDDLVSASRGPGTNNARFRLALQSIPDAKFDAVFEKLMTAEMNGESGLNELLNSEFERSDKDELLKIQNILNRKSKVYTLYFTMDQWGKNIKTFNIITKDEATKLDAKAFYEKWPCLEDDTYTDVRVFPYGDDKLFEFKTNGVLFRVALSTGKLYKGNSDTGEKARCAEERQDLTISEGLDNDEVKSATSGTDGQQQQGSQQQGNKQQNQRQRQRSGGNILKKGSKGENVVDVKMRLNKAIPKVFEDLKIITDDTYDGKTVAAVAYFQAKNNLKVDGIVGPNTTKALEDFNYNDNSTDSAVDTVDDGGQQETTA